jgi:hypothetical protein
VDQEARRGREVTVRRGSAEQEQDDTSYYAIVEEWRGGAPRAAGTSRGRRLAASLLSPLKLDQAMGKQFLRLEALGAARLQEFVRMLSGHDAAALRCCGAAGAGSR